MTVALALAIVPYAALMAFAHPVADDLAFAAAANVEGFWPALRIQYFTWNGRFASDVLALLNPIQTGSVLAYRLMLFALFVLTFAALYALVRVVTRPALTRREVLAGERDARSDVPGRPVNAAVRRRHAAADRSFRRRVGRERDAVARDDSVLAVRRAGRGRPCRAVAPWRSFRRCAGCAALCRHSV